MKLDIFYLYIKYLSAFGFFFFNLKRNPMEMEMEIGPKASPFSLEIWYLVVPHFDGQERIRNNMNEIK